MVEYSLVIPSPALEQHDLAFTIFRSGPAPQQQFGFFFPSDEGGQVGRVQCLEAAFNRNRPQRRPGPCRPGDALEVPVPEVLKLEEIAEKFSRALGDDDPIRLGDSLQTPWSRIAWSFSR
jgi:hypothetical protein